MPDEAEIAQVVEASEFFDEKWYLSRYADVTMLGMSAARHYVAVGASLLRDPSPRFSTRFYLESSPDVAAARVNPLWHYERRGRTEGRRIAAADWTRPLPLPDAPTPKVEGGPVIDKAARVIAFYLPQFHPIPENDEWWGQGFTEWTNVRPAKPMMPEHHQPHVPGELGYYDLRDTEVQRRQIELARLYGIEAFCFYFYWFAGKRLLEEPIRNYLDDSSLDFPFLICWANENWSRRWDGREEDVLIVQDHSPEDDLAFIEHISHYLRDPRYLRVDGRPVLLVYRPTLLPDPRETAERWRAWCREHGIGEIYIAYTQSFESPDPSEFGFDAAIEFPPNNSDIPKIQHHRAGLEFTGNVYDWTALVRRSFHYPNSPFPLYRGVNPSWDNTPRRRANGTVLMNANPAQFTRWTTNAFRDTAERWRDPDERLIFVNAWNEWGEGAHLEPDSVYGYAWLESIRVAHACALPPREIRAETARVHMLHGPLADLLPHLDDYDVVVRPGGGLDVEAGIAALESDPHLGVVFAKMRSTSMADHPTLGLAQRLGLTAREIEHSSGWDTGAFVARASAMRPLAALALDDGTRATTERAMPFSVTACGLLARDAGGSVRAPRSVLIVTHDAHQHGAQQLSLHLARSYGELGLDVHVMALGDGALLAHFREVATLHRVDPAHPRPAEVVRLVEELSSSLDFAIVNTAVSGPIVPLLRRLGVPTVSLIHEMPRLLADYGLELHARAIAQHADRVVFPAQLVLAGFEDFLGEPVKQATIRPQGKYLRSPHQTPEQRAAIRVSLRKQLSLPIRSRIVLGVGYADRRKGIDLWAAAAVHVLRADPAAVGVWVGHAENNALEEARELLREGGVETRVRFTGHVDNPEDFYAAADVFVLSSREDPFPSVVLEALDAGLPVVAFAGTTGSEELLQRGGGILVTELDGTVLGEAVLDLLRDPDRAGELGAEGRDLIASGFDFRDYVYELAEFAGRPLPTVSVVVPNYNYAEFIIERLRTILDQTVRIHELIVLDDSSSDESVGRVKEFLSKADVPWRLVENDTNSGSVFAQWRRGVELATGDLVWIAEADDLADPGFLAAVTPAFADPEVVLSYSQSRQMSGEGRILCEDYLDYVADVHPAKWHHSYVADGEEEIATALSVKNTIPNVSGVVFRRKPLAETLNEHFDEICSYRNAGDWVTYLRVLENGKVAFCARSLNNHRRHAQSVTVGNFDLSLLREILTVQRGVIRRHHLGVEAVAAADTYAQELYVQFGLATPEMPHFSRHPELNALEETS